MYKKQQAKYLFCERSPKYSMVYVCQFLECIRYCLFTERPVSFKKSLSGGKVLGKGRFGPVKVPGELHAKCGAHMPDGKIRVFFNYFHKILLILIGLQ